jgi:hypothetical protein
VSFEGGGDSTVPSMPEKPWRPAIRARTVGS